jgi:anti-sigma B factor antagonist
MTHTHWLDRQDDGELTLVRFRLRRLTEDDDTREVFLLLQRLVEVMGRKKLLLDFADVDYLASMAVAKLVMLNRLLDSVGGRLVLFGMNERIRNIFRITHLDDFLKIVGNEEEARTAAASTETSSSLP